MRRFCGMLDFQIKHLIRKKAWCILLGISTMITIGCFLCAYVLEAEPIVLLSQTVFGQALLTLSLMMIGIELRREDYQEHIDDLVSTYLRESALFPLSQIAVITIFAGIATAMVCIGCIIPLIIDHAPAEWIRQTTIHVIQVFFLPSMVMGFFGLIVSYLIPGKNVYLLAVLMWLLTSSLSIYFTGPLSEYFEEWRLVANIFSMGFNNYQMFRNVVTGENIEIPRWIVRCGFAVILSGIFVACYLKNCASTKLQSRVCKMRTGGVIFLGVVWIAFIVVRYSTFFIRFADDTYTQTLTYEAGQKLAIAKYEKIEDWPSEKNIFLKQTDIDISCTTQGTEVGVVMTGKMSLGTTVQSFTLLSEFVIDEIRVDGEKVEYERKADGIIIYFPKYKNEGETVQIQFKYHGYSLPSYPANETTVQLNRAMPWIPWPGISTISETELLKYNQSEVFFIDDWQRGDVVKYTLNYNGPKNVYTNLEKIEENVYSGYSDNGVTIYSGMLQEKHRDILIYYPASLYREAEIAAEAIEASYDIIQEYCKSWETPVLPKKPSTVVIIQMRYPMWGNIVFSANELYSWGETWEIRMRNESSSVLANYIRAERSGMEFDSRGTVVSIAIPYLLNPCSGYPIDVSFRSTDCFADLMAFSILAESWDNEDQLYYAERFVDTYSDAKNVVDQDLVDEIVLRMVNGEKFDEKLKEIYQKLLQSENIAPDEMIEHLISN